MVGTYRYLWALLVAAVLMSVASLPASAGGAPPQRDAGLHHAAALGDYMEESLSGGPSKDGIPAIDEPAFWTAEKANAYLDPGDIVFGVRYGGVTRAYPQRILVWHEIVNDTLGGTPVSITYCPLTGTALGFLRGETTFGVSGRLVNSNLIMYDRATDSYWPQVLATGIKGPETGASLQGLPVFWTTWERWRSLFPQTRVLSTDTGYIRDYQRDPYGRYNPREGYYEPDARRLFPVMAQDDRYPPKTVFLAARTEDSAIAFHMDRLRETGQLHGTAGGRRFTAVYLPALDSGVIVENPQGKDLGADAITLADNGVMVEGTGSGLSPVISFEAMWFAYAAFYPDGVVVD